MKRLWMRLGIVAGVLALGSTAIYLGVRSADGQSSEVETAATADPPKGEPPAPIPAGDDSTLDVDPTRFSGVGRQLAGADPVVRGSDAESFADTAPPRPSFGPPDEAARQNGAYRQATAGVSDAADYSAPTYGQYQPGYGQYQPNPYQADAESEPAYAAVADDEPDSTGQAGQYRIDASYVSDDNDATSRGGTFGARRSADTNPRQPAQQYSGAGPAAADIDVAQSSAPAYDPFANSAVSAPERPQVAGRVDQYERAPVEQPGYQQQLERSPRSLESLSSQRSTSPIATPTGGANLASDAPGSRQLDGVQRPTITLEKTAPEEIQVGKPATFKIHVRNAGDVAAHDVVVTDFIPLGTELLGALPEVAPSLNGVLTWSLGTLEPGQDVTLSVELLPQTEGEVGSVAQVGFQTQASVRTICTKPMLSIKQSAPSKVLIGEDVVVAITIANMGSGAASDVVLEADVPEGLAHDMGSSLKKPIGTLGPGEEAKFELVSTAVSAGLATNVVRAVGGGQLAVEDRTDIEVLAPQLQVGLRGPSRRFLERPVTYEVTIGNPGTAPAKNVDLVTYLPKGLQFVSADNKGKYDAHRHAVLWSLEELPTATTGTVQLTALPIESGQQSLLVQGKADMDLADDHEHSTLVEGIVELAFTLADLQDPIEVGSETTYEVRIVNQGSKAATNVQLTARLPLELTPLGADGATKAEVNGQLIIMDPLPRLAPQADAVYRIKVKGQQAGDHVIDVQLLSDDAQTPVIKQESTKVYADQ